MTPFHILPGTRIAACGAQAKPELFNATHASLGTSLGILQIRFVTIRWYHNNIPMILQYRGSHAADIVTEKPRVAAATRLIP